MTTKNRAKIASTARSYRPERLQKTSRRTPMTASVQRTRLTDADSLVGRHPYTPPAWHRRSKRYRRPRRDHDPRHRHARPDSSNTRHPIAVGITARRGENGALTLTDSHRLPNLARPSEYPEADLDEASVVLGHRDALVDRLLRPSRTAEEPCPGLQQRAEEVQLSRPNVVDDEEYPIDRRGRRARALAAAILGRSDEAKGDRWQADRQNPRQPPLRVVRVPQDGPEKNQTCDARSGER